MQHKETKQIEQLYDTRWTAVFMVIGFSMTFIARLLRPLPADAQPLTVLVVGGMPNFGAGLALPFFLLVLSENVFKKQSWPVDKQFWVACLITFLGLTAWELEHTLVLGIPFDGLDIVATSAEIACAFIAFRLVAVRGGV